jgi:hypothetical protein
MRERFNVRLPESMARKIRAEAKSDPIADGKVGRTIRILISEALRAREQVVPRGENAATNGDKLDTNP